MERKGASATVTAWRSDRGYGFCVIDETREQVFLHVSGLPNGWQSLPVGARIRLGIIGDGGKGLRNFGEIQILSDDEALDILLKGTR